MERSFHITHLVFGDIEDKVDVLRRRRHRKGRQSTAWSNDGAGIGIVATYSDEHAGLGVSGCNTEAERKQGWNK